MTLTAEQLRFMLSIASARASIMARLEDGSDGAMAAQRVMAKVTADLAALPQKAPAGSCVAAVNAGLPAGWIAVWDEQRYTYYYANTTNVKDTITAPHQQHHLVTLYRCIATRAPPNGTNQAAATQRRMRMCHTRCPVTSLTASLC